MSFHTRKIEQYIREGRTVSGGCGASSSENNISQQQQANFSQLTTQAQQEFGNSSQIFQDLSNSFAPVLAAGPGQSGFTAPELANLQSQAVTQGGIAARNAQQAYGEQAAAAGGGMAILPSGAVQANNANIAQASAANTANQLSNINLQNAQLGRQNWLQAAGVLSGAPGVYGTANSAAGTATNAGQAAFGGAQGIQQANSAWVGDVMGVLGDASQIASGGLAGGAFGGGGGNSSLQFQNNVPTISNGPSFNAPIIAPGGPTAFGTVPQ